MSLQLPNMPFMWADPLVRRYRGMNIRELIEFDGLTPDQAQHVMNARVYGVGYQLDKDGKPIERGIGSPGNETLQKKLAGAEPPRRESFLAAFKAAFGNIGSADTAGDR